MKAIVLQQPGRFEQIDIPEPLAPAAGEALVRVHRVGICGTDLSGYLGKMPFFSYPRIPGHELGVEVLAVGEASPTAEGTGNRLESLHTTVKPGDRCAVEPYINCGHCHACRKGASNCCANLKVLGVMTDGGLRDRFIVPAHKLHPSYGAKSAAPDAIGPGDAGVAPTVRTTRPGGNPRHRLPCG